MPEPSPASVKKMMASTGEGDTITRYPGLIDAFVAAGSDPIASHATQQERRAVIRGLRGFRPEFRFRETDLRRVRHPVLLICDRDPVGDVKAARQAATLLPHARLEMLPTGHAPFWGEPARTSELASRFLDDKADVASSQDPDRHHATERRSPAYRHPGTSAGSRTAHRSQRASTPPRPSNSGHHFGSG